MSTDPQIPDGALNTVELDTFMQKLEDFAQSLTPKERFLLLQVLTRTDTESFQDVEAHALRHLSLGAAALSLHERSKEQTTPR